ncbi:hypothetical protein [Litorimonas haliclonae]|uniref:glucuronyl esterase domain-containing protein n=1 Tax=Litorimonas haliclonae TaxID=2081977 RepID=UPI0039F105B4
MLRFLKLKRFWFGIAALVLVGSLVSCKGARLMMQQAPLKAPPLHDLPSLKSNSEMMNGLEEHIYGKIPELTDVRILSKKEIARNAFTPGDIITEWAVEAGYGRATSVFHIVFVRRAEDLKASVILTQNFCPNSDVVPVKDVTDPEGDFFECSGEGILSSIFTYFFGRYITVPPYQMILDNGYSVAVIFPPEFVPDSASQAPAILKQMFSDTPKATPGTLSVWASLTVWLADTLKTGGETDSVITYGHSRYGKTALISAAATASIDAVIAHQSGTGGASLLRDEKGESIAEIMESYPHWFTSTFVEYAENKDALPVDAHYLLALIAPRPVLLGNARRDVWSDPSGAFNAARAASSAWIEGDGTGLTATRLNDFRPNDDLSFWMRPGTHGVVEEDWPAFLEFLDAHFK